MTAITPARSSRVFGSNIYYNATAYPIPNVSSVTGCPLIGCSSGIRLTINGEYLKFVSEVQISAGNFSNYQQCSINSNPRFDSNFLICGMPDVDNSWINSNFTINLLSPAGDRAIQTNLFYSSVPFAILSVSGCTNGFSGCQSGDWLTITGNNLAQAREVRIFVPTLGNYYQNCSSISSSCSVIYCRLPQGLQQWVLSYYLYINVFTPLGNVTFQTSLYYSRLLTSSSSTGGNGRFSSSSSLAFPVITDASGGSCINSYACTSGDQIYITGNNLSPTIRVEISVGGADSQNCSVTSYTNSAIYCFLPTGEASWGRANLYLKVVTNIGSSISFRSYLFYASIKTSSSSSTGIGRPSSSSTSVRSFTSSGIALPSITNITGCPIMMCVPRII